MVVRVGAIDWLHPDAEIARSRARRHGPVSAEHERASLHWSDTGREVVQQDSDHSRTRGDHVRPSVRVHVADGDRIRSEIGAWEWHRAGETSGAVPEDRSHRATVIQYRRKIGVPAAVHVRGAECEWTRWDGH